ncbi:MAG: hypothetical protein J6Q30_04570, partial [Oscillospiraceae bacterium]|nr:hypothetical protein [Oscillospiraceae bacterium]
FARCFFNISIFKLIFVHTVFGKSGIFLPNFYKICTFSKNSAGTCLTIALDNVQKLLYDCIRMNKKP